MTAKSRDLCSSIHFPFSLQHKDLLLLFAASIPATMDRISEFGSWRIPGSNISMVHLLMILYPLAFVPAALGLYFQMKQRQADAEQVRGYRRLGVQGRSNIADEYDDKYTKPANTAGEKSSLPESNVKALFIYPIKSCAPVEVDEAEIDASGLKYDREFAIAEWEQPTTRPGDPEQPPLWCFRTLRDKGYEKLALIKPEIWLPESNGSEKTSNGSEKPGLMIVRYPNVPYGRFAVLDRLFIRAGMLPKQRSFQVPLVPPQNHDYPVEEVRIWFDYPKWFNYTAHVPESFKAFMGAKNDITLFRVDPEGERQVFRCAPRKEQVGYQPLVGFADGYPVHLLNLASIRDVAERVKKDIPRFTCRRYRGNLVVSGPPAFDEDDWKLVRVGGHEMYCSCHCVRCKLPNVDPDTAYRHRNEPDSTLRKYRLIDPGAGNNPCLGLNLVPAHSEGVTLRVGDRLELLERGDHRYIPQDQKKRPGV